MKWLGFTLLDMMIVVAIIGILATMAIPAFAKYNAEAKTVEAKINLDLIGKGAVAYFVQEHSYDNGKHVYTREYPSLQNKNRGTTNKSLIPLGGTPYETGGYKKIWNDGNSKIGQKHNPNDYLEEFNSFPWRELHFRITKPFYYSYNYEGEVGVGKGGTGKSYFVSTASACLMHICTIGGKNSNTGKAPKSDCDSGFVIVGGPQGKVSPIMDNSDFTIEHQCGKSLLTDIRANKKVDLNKY